LIEVRDLKKSFGTVNALRGVSFIAREKRVHGLIGHNGAGKTTTLRIILGLLKPDHGSVIVDGYDVTKRPEIIWRKSGYVAEEEGYYDYLNAYEYLEFFSKTYGLTRQEAYKRIKELIEMLGMENYAHRRIITYSRGMKRRLALARALLHNPEILILDEPMSGLSPEATKEIRDLILKLAKEELAGKTILISSHNLWEIEQICDDITILYRGRVVFTGTLEELRNIIGIKPRFKIRLARPINLEFLNNLQSSLDFKLININIMDMEYTIECSEETIMKVLNEFSKAGANILSLSEEKMTLNDIYNELWRRLRWEEQE